MANYARPVSPDITTGLWYPSAGTYLYEPIDEETRADGDYIYSQANQETLCEVTLSSLTDPESSSGHIVRYTYMRTSGSKNLTLVVRLMQSTTTIASWSHVNPPTGFTLAQQTLTSGQADAITDYTDLSLQFEVTVNAGGGNTAQVSWAEFEVPGATVVTGTAAITAKAGVTAAGAQMTHLGVAAITAKAGVTAAGTIPLGDEIDSNFVFPHDDATSCLSWNLLGPFCDASENLYVVGIDHTTGYPEVWKSGNGGETWGQQDSSESFSVPLDGGWGLGVCQISNQLLMVSFDTYDLVFYRFGLSNYPSTPDTWLETETVITTTGSRGNEAGATIAATSDSEWIILYSGTQTPVTEYERCWYAYTINGGSNWTVDQVFCDEGSYDNNVGTIGVAPWGDVVGWWKRDDTEYASARWATDVDQTFSSQLDVMDYLGNPQNFVAPHSPPVCYLDGTDEIIVFIHPDEDVDPDGYVRSTYITNGTPASSTQVSDMYIKMCPSDAGSPHQGGIAADVDGTDVYVMMVSDSDDNIYVVKNSDNGGWGAETLLGGGGTCERLTGRIYERDGWIRFGIVFEKAAGGPINFYEYDIRAVATIVTGSAAIAAKAGVTAAGSVEVQAGTTGVTAKAATSAAALLQVIGALGITARGGVSASGIAFALVTGDAAIGAQASTSAQGVLEVMATLGISAQAAMTPVGWLEVLGGSQIAAQAGVSADALDIVLAALAIAAEAGMVVSGDTVSTTVYGDASIVAATGVTAAGLWGEVSPWCDWVYETTLSGGAIVTGTAALLAKAALASSAYLEIPGVIAIEAKGAVAGTAYLYIPGASQIGAAASAAISGLLEIYGSSNIQAAAGLSASGLQEVLAAAAIAGQGGLSAAALLEVLGSSTIAAAAAIGSDSYLIIPGDAAIEARALLTAVAEVLGYSVVSGSASIGAEASLAAGAYLITAGSADVQALGGLTVDGLLEVLASSSIDADAGVASAAILIRPGAADIQAAAAIVASGEYEILAQALIQPAAGVSTDAYLFVFAQAEVDGKLRIVAIPTQWVEMVIKRIHAYRGI